MPADRDPTATPVPPRAGDVYESWRRYARELAKVHGVWDEAVAAGRTAAAAAIRAEAAQLEERDGVVISYAYGFADAADFIDPPAARIAEGEAR